MDLRPETMDHSRPADRFRLSGAEESFLAEYIDIVGQPFPADDGQHFVNDEVTIALVVVPVFGRIGMGAQEAGPDAERRSFFQFFYDAQHLQLSFRAETVAALDLDGAGAQAAQFLQSFPGRVKELVFRSMPQLLCGIQDASPPGVDLR